MTHQEPMGVEQPPRQLTAAQLRRIEREAKQAAERVLEDWWDRDKFPVDPYKIASDMDVEVFTADLEGETSGLLRKEPQGTPKIYVNRRDTARRRRFTASHELGHFAQRFFDDPEGLDAANIAYIDGRTVLATRGDDPREVFANKFAAHLLMPEPTVKMLRKAGMGIGELAAFFDVSSLSMEYRLKNLGLA